MARVTDAVTATDFKLAAVGPDTVTVSGALGFTTAAAALAALNAALGQGARHRLDLAGVATCDSAGLACVLAVLAEAASRSRPVQVVNAPASLHTLAQVCGVETLLG
jgi:phospholipid transport system transporter-binding protein